MRSYAAAGLAMGWALLAPVAWAQDDEAQGEPEAAVDAERASDRRERPRGGVREVTPGASQLPLSEMARVTGAGLDLRPELFGYLKAGYFLVVPQSQDAEVGSNSGFRLINARLGITLNPAEGLWAVVSVDGSVPERRATDPLEGQRVMALRDAYIEYAASPFLRIRGGQFKAPFGGETLLPDHAVPFIVRSVVSEGVLPPEGPAREGLALPRQVGLQLFSDRLGDVVGVQYALAVVNGNGPNELFNDNNSVTPIGRLALSYTERAELGVNGYYDQASLGARPRIAENRFGFGADATVNLGGLNVMAMFLGRHITHPDTNLPSELGLGGMFSVKYLLEDLGFEGGARVAYYDPSDAQQFDQVTELTAMVGYRATAIPARILLQYTHRLEDRAVELGNNSVDLLAQVTF